MDKVERERAKEIAASLKQWSHRAASVLATRKAVTDEAAAAAREFERRIYRCGVGQTVLWKTFNLRSDDRARVTALRRAHEMPKLSEVTHKALNGLTDDRIRLALTDSRSAFGARRLFASKDRKDKAAGGVRYLVELDGRLTGSGALNALAQLERWDPALTPDVAENMLLAPEVGFAQRLPAGSQVIDMRFLAPARAALVAIDRSLRQVNQVQAAVATAAEALRQAETMAMVAEMPIERLRDATSGQLRLGALREAGINTVGQALQHEAVISVLPGVGEVTGKRMIGAARTIWQTTLDEMPVRIDIAKRTPAATELLRALRAWDAVRSIGTASAELAAVEELRAIVSTVVNGATHLVVIPAERQVADLRTVRDRVTNWAGVLGHHGGGTSGGPADPWEDFFARPADYYAMLSELGLSSDDEEGTGDLPDEILDAVRDLKLETAHLRASLRGYQSFGARFAIVQRKVIVGDEMGLGKTVEALAVLTHLRAKGSHHFLVVCPAAVVTNWIREVRSKSDLWAFRLHGQGRDDSLKQWIRDGGVAVTTYDSLAWLEGRIPAKAAPSCLVFDEAHYIKNPSAKRTERSRALIDRTPRAILLTGTPLENRIEEFRNLVDYLRPDLTVDAGEHAPRQFRKQVAPVYLRRNQEDVLTELPELVEVEEWLPLSDEDQRAYRASVAQSNFMAMRQAAMRAGRRSEKIRRLLDIVEEAEENHRKVLVFSHFREALDDVARILPGKVFGPLTGSVPAAKRQEMVDEFSQAPRGAVLVAQIVAGGVGLNIQFASVVVICEPQLKPTTEWQAIARARRMGQLETVQVHRLLSEEGVDRRITDILGRKRELFDDFARVSATADSAPEAFDISDAEIAREIVAAERKRLLGGPAS
ncbi:DEAD/DEAH box helicase [Lentzea sp. CC55]|uniref:DEAD/DEAH box helicase n=1 Tax=Lentzea sp. CC55 TaxID=2884909 RepID=UPI001F25D8EC|nr:DEAD/DEAH box helicase [Lentzea sp. CC55]MCG8927373.1 DEAD/DEAH box helicase [Lentzea sp. CC55]